VIYFHSFQVRRVITITQLTQLTTIITITHLTQLTHLTNSPHPMENSTSSLSPTTSPGEEKLGTKRKVPPVVLKALTRKEKM
jgi:hypothetical protein